MTLIGPLPEQPERPLFPTPWTASTDQYADEVFIRDANGNTLAETSWCVGDGLDMEVSEAIVVAVNAHYGDDGVGVWKAEAAYWKRQAEEAGSDEIVRSHARITELEYALANLDDIRKADEQRIRELEEEIRNKEDIIADLLVDREALEQRCENAEARLDVTIDAFALLAQESENESAGLAKRLQRENLDLQGEENDDYGPVSMPPGDTRSFPEGQRVTDIRNANESVCTGERKTSGVVVVRWGLDDEVDYVDPRYLRRVWENIERPSDLPEDVIRFETADDCEYSREAEVSTDDRFSPCELPVVEVLPEEKS